MATIRYETESCSRCGGSGEHSYCQMHGTTCFKCGGGRKQLTRAGSKARARVTEEVDARTVKVEAKDLVEGMVVRLNIGGSVRPRTILSIERDGSVAIVNGVRTPYVVIETKAGRLGVVETTKVDLALTSEAWAEVVEIARTLKGAAVVEA